MHGNKTVFDDARRRFPTEVEKNRQLRERWYAGKEAYGRPMEDDEFLRYFCAEVLQQIRVKRICNVVDHKSSNNVCFICYDKSDDYYIPHHTCKVKELFKEYADYLGVDEIIYDDNTLRTNFKKEKRKQRKILRKQRKILRKT